MMIFAVSAVD
jgi:hypothetical protein